ncbi:GTP-binding protein Rhes [Cololabis saira]|uniref:GTP-binding protein Rhes n=1 Tax=Cololabis saira TaxID=129043 RepID=UPI002AD385C1|nr:GTP-binding protein Rhes [Cololabis saira]
MNATEKFNLPVDGILDMFNSFTGHRQSPISAHAALQSTALTPLFQHPKVSSIPKTGMGIIKTVKGCWRRPNGRVTRRSSSSGNPHTVSTDRPSKKSLEQPEMRLSKPSNRHRVVVLGARRVGKSNILRRFLGEDYEEHYEPTVEDFYTKLFLIGGKAYQIDLLDAAGEREFPAKRRLSILTGDIFLVVFSLDDRESLNEALVLLDEIKAAKAKLLKCAHPAVPVVVCGNKADLGAHKVQVGRSEVGQILGEDVPFFETSAKSGSGLEGVFKALATLGGLPVETCPSRHQVVPIRTYRSLRGGRRGRRGTHGAQAAMDPLAQRPSFTSDLQMVLGSSIKHKKPEKCQIQ